MRGGFLISVEAGLFQRAASVLVELGATRSIDGLGDGIVQLADGAGRLFTLYEQVPSGTEWEVREGTFEAAHAVRLPDMQSVIACPFECRWSDLVARLADVIAQASEAPTWVLDGNGVVWDAAGVNASEVVL